MVAAGGEAPATAEPEPTVDRLGPTHRGVGGRDEGRLVLAPHLLLRAVVEQRELPGVYAEHGGHPTGRAAGARDRTDGAVELDRRGFQAAVAGGLEQAEEATLLQGLDRPVRDAAQVLGLLRAVTETRQQLRHGVEDCCLPRARSSISPECRYVSEAVTQARLEQVLAAVEISNMSRNRRFSRASSCEQLAVRSSISVTCSRIERALGGDMAQATEAATAHGEPRVRTIDVGTVPGPLRARMALPRARRRLPRRPTPTRFTPSAPNSSCGRVRTVRSTFWTGTAGTWAAT